MSVRAASALFATALAVDFVSPLYLTLASILARFCAALAAKVQMSFSAPVSGSHFARAVLYSSAACFNATPNATIPVCLIVSTVVKLAFVGVKIVAATA